MNNILFLLTLIPSYSLQKQMPEKTVFHPPSSVSFDGSDYTYRVVWDHDNEFDFVAQYYKGKLSGGFVLYTGDLQIKDGEVLNIRPGIRFIKVGTACYYKRVVHIFVPIRKTDITPEKIDIIHQELQPKIADFFGEF